MQQARNWRYASLLTAAALLVLTVGAGALAFFELTIPQLSLDPGQSYLVQVGKDTRTGFSIRNDDVSVLTINDFSTKYDPAAGLESGQQVQEGFILLDGTLSLD